MDLLIFVTPITNDVNKQDGTKWQILRTVRASTMLKLPLVCPGLCILL